jgi:hypothetical protein
VGEPFPFGKYFLLDRINVGGMAEVWKAKTYGVEGFEKIVAIKRILPSIAEDEEFISMFIDEAKIAVQLSHASIAQVYDLGKIEDSFFIAMEYVAGKDLRAIFDRMRKRHEILPFPLTCHIVGRLCEGLDYAHRRLDGNGHELSIVHRDVSPQNVLISFEGEVKLIDFGIAKAANKVSRTRAGVLKGKFGYMSPEQVRGLPVDRRSDVFALGILLYELLTGERLFFTDSDFTTLEKVRTVDILPPRSYNPRIPEALERIVLKALAREPAERTAWASELGEELQRFGQGHEGVTQRDLARFMKSTFAEDLEREKVKAAEAAQFRLPVHMSPFAREKGRGALPEIRRTMPPPPESPEESTERAEVPLPLPPGPPPAPRPRAVLLVIPVVIGAALLALRMNARPETPAYLVVATEPASAEVLVDDALIKPSGPGVPPSVELAPGEHRLRVRSPGKQDHVLTFVMKPGERLPLTVRLEPAP